MLFGETSFGEKSFGETSLVPFLGKSCSGKSRSGNCRGTMYINIGRLCDRILPGIHRVADFKEQKGENDCVILPSAK
jgi:hypothetical protein